MLDGEDEDDVKLEAPLYEENEKSLNQDLKIFIFLICLNIVVITIVTIIIINFFREDKKPNIPKSSNSFQILLKDKDFIKPNIKINSEFELVKTKNGMTGLLISNPYSSYSFLELTLGNGSYIDTVPGLAHFAEHMIFGGSEKYKYYSILKMKSIKGFVGNAGTGGTEMMYYVKSLNNFKFEKAVDKLTDAFRYPRFDEEIIKKEIQPVNSEFYFRKSSRGHILNNIMRQLSSNETSFNGFSTGTNQTLKPDESLSLRKKLKGFHMTINRPENIFFILLSNKSIDVLEDYAEKYLSYSMHQFNEDEIDVEDKKKLEKNIKDLNEKDIFDHNLYGHWAYYNSNIKQNILDIFFNIGKVDYKSLNFEITKYFEYLFNSKPLLKILKEKEYLATNDGIILGREFSNENNFVFTIEIILTQKGIDNIDDILLIIYRHIDILKTKGFDKEYFLNFIKYNHNLIINNFRNKFFEDTNKVLELTNIYREKRENQILNFGLLKENDYDENKLKEYLNNIKFEKSFYIVNSISDIKEVKSHLKGSFIEKKLKYYNINYLYGEFSNELKDNIKRNIPNNGNNTMRKINPYYSGKYFEKVKPCYKQSPNRCKELNEFDLEKDESYKGTLFEDDKYYMTYYQIDKSSEAFIVNSYLEFNLNEDKKLKNETLLMIELSYIKDIIAELEFNKLDMVSVVRVNSGIAFKIKSFTDNTESIIKTLIDHLKNEPKEEDLNFLKNKIQYQIIKEKEYPTYYDYIKSIFRQFMQKGKITKNIFDTIKSIIEKIKNEELKDFHKMLINNIKALTFKIVGNIDKNLVGYIHKYLKDNIKVTPNNSTTRKLDSKLPKIINYYQKSNLTKELDNGILIIYTFDENYQDYMNIFGKCFLGIGNSILRLNYSNSYTPKAIIEKGGFSIFEQGRYKSVGEMEDDINKVLFGMLNGTIQCENYEDIIESHKIKTEEKREKTSDELFIEFITGKTLYNISFNELIKKISHIFTDPTRIAVLISRSDLTDEEYKKLVENRKNNAKYIINEQINIIHTEEINYLNSTKL